VLVCYHTACNAACARGGEHRCVRLSVRPQVLADARLRKAYDYALEHPDEHMYNSMRYYNAAAVKYWKTDARAVVLSIIAVVSGIQYANQYWVYESVRPRPPALPRAAAFASLANQPCLLTSNLQVTLPCARYPVTLP